MTITQAPSDAYQVSIHSVDETDVPLVAHSVVVKGDNVTIAIDMDNFRWADYHRRYSGTLSADGSHINGTWSIPDGPSIPLNYERERSGSSKQITPVTHLVSVEPHA